MISIWLTRKIIRPSPNATSRNISSVELGKTIMSLDTLAHEVQSRLTSANDAVESALAKVSKENLRKVDEFTKRFQLSPLNVTPGELDKFTFSQLNNKGERVQANLNHLKRLSIAYKNIQECELILSQPNILLLDLKRLYSILVAIEQASDKNYSLAIYDNIHKWCVTTRGSLASALNDALVSAVPTPYSIANIELLHEICTMAQGWGISLSYMKDLRSKWDAIATKIMSEPGVSLKFDDSNLIDDSVAMELGSDASISPIKSIAGFVEFINHTRIEALKQFLSSKISNMLTASISANIDTIISDPARMKELKHFIELCSLTEWNVLKLLRGGLMQTNLNAMHVEWQIVSYISQARLLIKKGSVEIQTPWTPDPDAASGSEPKEAESADWDNGWDDDWDVQVDDDELDSTKGDPGPAADSILVSDVAREIFALLLDYTGTVSSDTLKLAASVTALLSTAYANFPNPFSLYNDLLYLGQSTKTASFGKSAEAYWNQCLARYYSDLRAVILLLSLNSGHSDNEENQSTKDDDEFDSWGEDDEVFVELSEHNQSQLSLLHLWFKNVFEESEMAKSNPQKFEGFAIDMIDYVNTCFFEAVFTLEEITGNQLKIIPTLVDAINNITVPCLNPLNKSRSDIKSYHQLDNIKFLMNSSMKQIMDKFFEGDLFDVATEDLVNIIKAIFVESDTRTGYLNEIVEFRSSI